MDTAKELIDRVLAEEDAVQTLKYELTLDLRQEAESSKMMNKIAAVLASRKNFPEIKRQKIKEL